MNGDISIYPEDNFFKRYFSYVGYPHNTEASLTVHRWCAISVLGALLGRQFLFPFGDGELLPNSFIQIIGVPATRKSTAIKQAKKLLKRYGYQNFAPEKISLEKFLMELHELTWGTDTGEDLENPEQSFTNSIFGSDNPKEAAELLEIAEMYIASDEFVDFIGRNNIDFISLLGTLWDYSGVYDRKLKHSKAVYINNPTINIIAGNTHEGFNQAFPPEIQGQGFFSRLILIHAEPTGRKITIPKAPSQEAIEEIIKYMQAIKTTCIGHARYTDEAEQLMEALYNSWKDIEDTRFEHYSGRRSTHLLKLSLVCAAARLSREIHSCDIIMANTLLTYAEYQMPKAMGHFGKGKHSAVIHKILAHINAADSPVTVIEIMKLVHTDVDKLPVVNDLISELVATNKIQAVKTANSNGFLPVRSARAMADTNLIKPSWLWPEEKKIL